MKDTCFVIMPIGTQRFGFGEISAQDLRGRYTDLIREAVLRARPTIEILRADDIAAPGGITTDIFTALMESRYVVADVTFPNPNVFYELGIRHACRTGTVLLRERRPEAVPFDIFDLRHIEYENTPTGLKMLAERMCEYFDWLDTNPEKPDNRFLELALLKHYEFQSSTKVRRLASIKEKLAGAVGQEAATIQAAIAEPTGEQMQEIMNKALRSPKVMALFMEWMVVSGQMFDR